ncbi:reverse transcriptase, partial [Phytophthora megakarya]
MLNRGELVDKGTQTEESSPVTTRMDASTQVSESQLDRPGWDPGEGDTPDDDRGDTFVDVPPEWTTEFEEVQGGETPAEVHPEQDTSESSPEPASWTPLEKLEMYYERCMRVSADNLDLEPGVYIHEESEMLAQLRDQLVMLPELSELHPECDIDQADVGVPDAKPIALRPRSIGPHVAVKVYELLKKLLENNLIEHSESQWVSPIVIVLTKNGVDIRIYPLPLIDDLLVGFEKALWFMSLDMASGFWHIKMTERAKLISAFVCPFGHFQWIRMPFGLKNAPLIYQQVINNCLPGSFGLSESGTQDNGPPGCGTPGCSGCEDDHASRLLPTLVDQMTVFKRNIPAPTQMSPVLGHSSYINDIAHGAPTWDALCADLDALLYRLRYWNISVSLPKSEFEKLSIPYLSHEISAEGIRATPKIAKGVQDLPFPTTLKGPELYHNFIEDYPVVAASLYELSDDQVRSGRDLSRAKQAFEILKHKIISTPGHPDRTKRFVIIPHANQWAACAVLGQERDGLIQP